LPALPLDLQDRHAAVAPSLSLPGSRSCKCWQHQCTLAAPSHRLLIAAPSAAAIAAAAAASIPTASLLLLTRSTMPALRLSLPTGAVLISRVSVLASSQRPMNTLIRCDARPLSSCCVVTGRCPRLHDAPCPAPAPQTELPVAGSCAGASPATPGNDPNRDGCAAWLQQGVARAGDEGRSCRPDEVSLGAGEAADVGVEGHEPSRASMVVHAPNSWEEEVLVAGDTLLKEADLPMLACPSPSSWNAVANASRWPPQMLLPLAQLKLAALLAKPRLGVGSRQGSLTAASPAPRVSGTGLHDADVEQHLLRMMVPALFTAPLLLALPALPPLLLTLSPGVLTLVSGPPMPSPALSLVCARARATISLPACLPACARAPAQMCNAG
jgi:hypothetical protein